MPALYEICSELAQVTAGEELSPDLETQLDALSLAFPVKVDGCCRLIQEWRGEATRFAAEAARLAEISDGYARRADSLKEYVRRCLDVAGLRTLDTELFRLRVQNNPPSVDVVGDPPPQFMRVKTVCEWDKKAAMAALKNGDSVPGAELRVGARLVGVS